MPQAAEERMMFWQFVQELGVIGQIVNRETGERMVHCQDVGTVGICVSMAPTLRN